MLALEGTLVISPDNESRRELNSLIHREMQNHLGAIKKFRVNNSLSLTGDGSFRYNCRHLK
jgi:hypothetical protein